MTDFGVRRRVLPQTGQTISYRHGDDGYFEKGWNEAPRFKVIGDGTLIDNATGLMWPTNAAGPAGYGGGINLWTFAIDYLIALDFAGHTDWRLPNVFELASLLDYSLSPLPFNPLIQHTGAKDFWTSTTYANLTTNVWFYENRHERFYTMPKTYIFHFFCCRDA